LAVAQASVARAQSQDTRLGHDLCLKGEYGKGASGGGGRGPSIRKVLLSLRAAPPPDAAPRQYALAIAIERTALPQHLTLKGRCGFGERANRESADKTLFPGAPDKAGFRCSLSAEIGPQGEGGKLLVLLGANLGSATLYLPARLTAHRGEGEDAKPILVKLADEERVLRLEHVHPEGCSALAPSQPI